MNKRFFIFAAVITCLVTQAIPDARAEATALERIHERGVLEVAVYSNFPPFSYRDDQGRIVGIDADLARALAKSLGVAAAIRTVGADETMEDDLRNNIWKGHYLGGGVADLMLHVPYDAAFAAANDRVHFLAPYFREQIVTAIGKHQGAGLDPLELFTREKVGVELDTLADFYLLSALDGKIREQVVHFRNIGEAVTALKKAELSGVAGPRSEIEFALGEQRGEYVIDPVSMPGLRSGWNLGSAVKQGNAALAEAVELAMAQLQKEGKLKEIFSRYQSSFQPPSLKVEAEELASDPLDSVMWKEMHRTLLDGGPVVFDNRVRVLAPGDAEDSMNVPILVDASALGKVTRLLVFAELNPIHKVLEMEPMQLTPRVGFRLKVQQTTPVRAAALTRDGRWHVGGRIVEAAGGGCTAPSLGSNNKDWSSRMGEVNGRLWRGDDSTRLRMRIMHPMDTGLVSGIPAFYIERLEVRHNSGDLLTRLFLYEPVSENPVITLDLPKLNSVTVAGQDNNGNPVQAHLLAGYP